MESGRTLYCSYQSHLHVMYMRSLQNNVTTLQVCYQEYDRLLDFKFLSILGFMYEMGPANLAASEFAQDCLYN